MKASRRIRTLLYEDQRFTDFEIDLLHTPALQRLYDLHQLGYADRVFIDASHSRLQHVVGVVEQADKIITAVISNLNGTPTREFLFGENGLDKRTGKELADSAHKRRWAVRLMGLLHDLTHAPYGHTLEDEIELVDQKHDEPARQADAFFRLTLQYFGWIERNGERRAWGVVSSKEPPLTDYAAHLDWYLDASELNTPDISEEFIEYLAKRWAKMLTQEADAKKSLRRIPAPTLIEAIRDLEFAFRALLHLEIAHKDPDKIKPEHLPSETYPVLDLLNKLLREAGHPNLDKSSFQPHRDAYLLDIIGNTICADLLDYARRDATLSGLKLAYDPERIISTMTVVPCASVRGRILTKQGLKPYPFNGSSLRTAVSIFSHKLRLDVPGELLNLLQVRFYVYERMLFHPTKCVAGAMLGAAMQNIGWKTLPEHWRHVGDVTFLREAREAARYIRDLLHDFPDKEAQFDEKVVGALKLKVATLPVCGFRAATECWLDGKIKVKKEELLKLLLVADLGSNNGEVARRLHSYVSDLDKARFPDDLVSDLNSMRKELANVATSAGLNPEPILEDLFPNVAYVSFEVEAGIRLLDRLAARRYHKVTFRLLPNAPVVDGAPTGLSPTTIANKFLDASVRKRIEREIAVRAGIPFGSVAIHCPPAKGPTKIANIVMIDGGDQKQARLREIAKLDPEIFKEHQEAVVNQENLYKSTWRLAVSIAPPFDADWETINPIIGKALFQALGGARELDNDRFMVRELQAQVESIASTFQNAVRDASEVDDEDLREIGKTAVRLLRASNTGMSESAADIQKRLEIRLRSNSGGGKREKANKASDGLFPLWMEESAVIKEFNRVATRDVFALDERTRPLVARVLKLTPAGQKLFHEFMKEIAVPKNIKQNRVATETDLKAVLDLIVEKLEIAEDADQETII